MDDHFLVRMWRGDVPLRFTYWIWGVVIGALVNMATLADANVPFLTVLSLTYFVFICIAIWRSADRYMLIRPTRRAWGYLAQVAVVLGVLKTVVSFVEGIRPLT